MAVKEAVLSNKTSILFVSFSKWIKNKRLPTNGSIEPLRDFLVPQINRLVIIDQPHPGSDEVMPKIEEYKDQNFKFKSYTNSIILNILKPFLLMSKSENTQIRFKLRDFFSVVDWVVLDKERYDYFIGLESINTLAGILLRRFGRVGKVVYYVSDYSPNRYPSNWFNSLYLKLDRFCAEHADYIWDVSKAMQKARISVGLDPKKSAKCIHVPNGLNPKQIKAIPESNRIKNNIIYMGTLTEDNGPDIAIQSMPLILNEIPNAKLHMIGGTKRDLEWLKNMTKKLNILNSVIFYGFVPKIEEMSKIMRKCSVGVAPYKDIPGSIRKYADAGKIRAYCASGLPVVSSHVPPLGKDAEKSGAAVIVKDNSESFSRAIISILQDKKMYNKLRSGSINFAKNSTWDNTFENAFKQMI